MVTRKIDKIYLHCSYSEWGSVGDIRAWHTGPPQNWSDVGYHYVIDNQFNTYLQFKNCMVARANPQARGKERLYSTLTDGCVHEGRPISIQGAHVKNDNANSIGICYIGISPTAMQLSAMLTLCKHLCVEYAISVDKVLGHYEYWTEASEKPAKTCPNIVMKSFRLMLEVIM